MEQECTIRVLGPVDIVKAGSEMSVGGPQARAILGALAIGAGHAVAVDHLHQTLWYSDRKAMIAAW